MSAVEELLASPTRQRIENLLANYVEVHDLGVISGEKALCVFPRNDYEPDIVFFGREKAAKLRSKTLKFPVRILSARCFQIRRPGATAG